MKNVSNLLSLPNIIHIHTDPKFIYTSYYFLDTYFCNKIFLLNGDDKVLKENPEIFLIDTSKHLRKIIDACNNADLVVLYCLDKIKLRIGGLINSNIKIAWFFFGYELYQYDKHHYLSPYTQKIVYRGKKYLWDRIKEGIKQAFPQIHYQAFQFEKIVERINYFMCLSDYEYNHLKYKWPNLPSFVQMPVISPDKTKYTNSQTKNNTVILGNSRNFWNNHLDVIDIINHSSNSNNYNFLLPLSYGNQDDYYKAILNAIKQHKNITPLNNFLPVFAYESLFLNAGAFVLNSYRQMAMGNIFIAINSGVKIYLNAKSVTYHWLLNNNFLIFTIEEFKADLLNNNLKLSHYQIEKNVLLFTQLSDKHSAMHLKNIMYKNLN